MSKRMLEKLALPTIKEELPRLHASHAQMLPEEAETEYLKVTAAFLTPLLPKTLQCCWCYTDNIRLDNFSASKSHFHSDCPAVARVWGDVPPGG